MSNLGPQFAVKDWNPFAAAAQMVGSITALENLQHKRALMQIAAHNKPIQPTQQRSTTITKQEKPTPQNTGAPIPGYRVQGPISPSTTGAPVPGTLKNNTSTHPITGAKVPRTPVKPKGAKPTAPGTRPKKK